MTVMNPIYINGGNDDFSGTLTIDGSKYIEFPIDDWTTGSGSSATGRSINLDSTPTTTTNNLGPVTLIRKVKSNSNISTQLNYISQKAIDNYTFRTAKSLFEKVISFEGEGTGYIVIPGIVFECAGYFSSNAYHLVHRSGTPNPYLENRVTVNDGEITNIEVFRQNDLTQHSTNVKELLAVQPPALDSHPTTVTTIGAPDEWDNVYYITSNVAAAYYYNYKFFAAPID